MEAQLLKDALLLSELGQIGHQMGSPRSRAISVKELQSHLTDPPLKSLALRLSASLEKEDAIGAAFFLQGSNKERASILEALRQRYLADGGQPILYHGTTLGRLKGILEKGLTPGHEGNWKKDNLAAHCAGHVFLTATAQAAATWAVMAHQRGRGPRGSRNRRPIVLRIPIRGLSIASDSRSVDPHAVMTSDVVPISEALAAYVCTSNFRWLSPSDMVNQVDLPEFIDPAETAEQYLCRAERLR